MPVLKKRQLEDYIRSGYGPKAQLDTYGPIGKETSDTKYKQYGYGAPIRLNMGSRLVANGITVLFDATASRRSYREFARGLIPRFAEVAIECPLAICMQWDKKGTYDKGLRGESTTVPGLQAPYEAPLKPDLTIATTVLSPSDAADQIVALVKKKFVEARK